MMSTATAGVEADFDDVLEDGYGDRSAPPAPTSRYDTPRWCAPKVARDHFVQVERALYSMPTRLIGRTLRARVDRATVRFYDRSQLVRVCERLQPGGRHVNPDDFPAEQRAYATRDRGFLQQQADECGPNVGEFVRRLLRDPRPWTRMRTVYGVLTLVKRRGVDVVERCCGLALAADMLSLKRLTLMVEQDLKPHPYLVARPMPPARFLWPARTYALKTPPTQGEPS